MVIEISLPDIVLLENPVFIRMGVWGKAEMICVRFESLWTAVRRGMLSKDENNER